jgi:hypothetical protein
MPRDEFDPSAEWPLKPPPVDDANIIDRLRHTTRVLQRGASLTDLQKLLLEAAQEIERLRR